MIVFKSSICLAIESQERNTGKTSKVLRLLSNSGGKHNVEELKNIRKQHGAQSKQYKNALTILEKCCGSERLLR